MIEKFLNSVFWIDFVNKNRIEQGILDSNAAKQLSQTATDVSLSPVLKKSTTFKYRLKHLPPDITK